MTRKASTLSRSKSPEPLYMQVTRSLEKRIREGVLKAHDRLPSIAELAGEFEVSDITARRSVRELTRMNLAYTQPRVGVFVSGEARAALDGAQDIRLSHAAVVVSRISDTPADSPSSYPRMHQGIKDGAREHRTKLTFSTVRDINRCGGMAAYAQANGIQGVILLGIVDEAYIREVASAVPVVLLDKWVAGEDVASIVVDNVPAAFVLTKHLLDLGHERIAYVGQTRKDTVQQRSVPDPDSEERVAGYRIALEQAGIAVDDALIYPNLEGEEKTLDEILSTSPLPTAIVSFGRSLAFRLADKLASKGISIPGDMSLATFSSDPACLDGDYPLTCLYVDAADMGRLAFKKLREHVSQGKSEEQKISMPGMLVPGPSTTPPRKREKK